MQSFNEISIDLTAQELGDSSTVTLIEVDDIEAFNPLLPPGTAANTDLAGVATPATPTDDDIIEIELTAEQMDAMLSAQPRR